MSPSELSLLVACIASVTTRGRQPTYAEVGFLLMRSRGSIAANARRLRDGGYLSAYYPLWPTPLGTEYVGEVARVPLAPPPRVQICLRCGTPYVPSTLYHGGHSLYCGTKCSDRQRCQRYRARLRAARATTRDP